MTHLCLSVSYFPQIFSVATKATKSVDLFGSGDEGDDDDSLFGAKPAKKTEVKAEPPKKKVPNAPFIWVITETESDSNQSRAVVRKNRRSTGI